MSERQLWQGQGNPTTVQIGGYAQILAYLEERCKMEERKKTLIDICSDLEDISVTLDRANAVADNLCANYFGYNAEWHRKDNGMSLLIDYEESRNFAEIVSDYVYRAKEQINRLIDGIEVEAKNR
ncbi:MAG: hypothetical protein IJW67_04065 [Blautia sp.]|nr:hypothetical protein [Blautia sp.]